MMSTRYMHEQYGAKVFGNILSSEQKHQEAGFDPVTSDETIADPRSSELGVYSKTLSCKRCTTSSSLRGKQSAEEAYKVGVDHRGKRHRRYNNTARHGYRRATYSYHA
jgi:hypothetical protein